MRIESGPGWHTGGWTWAVRFGVTPHKHGKRKGKWSALKAETGGVGGEDEVRDVPLPVSGACVRLTCGTTLLAQHFALASSSLHSPALRRFLFPNPSSLLLLLRRLLPACVCAPNCVRCIPRHPDGSSPSLLHFSALGVLCVCVCAWDQLQAHHAPRPIVATTVTSILPHSIKSVCPHLFPSSLRAHHPSVLVGAETHTRCTICSARQQQQREGTRTTALEKAKTARHRTNSTDTRAHDGQQDGPLALLGLPSGPHIQGDRRTHGVR